MRINEKLHSNSVESERAQTVNYPSLASADANFFTAEINQSSHSIEKNNILSLSDLMAEQAGHLAKNRKKMINGLRAFSSTNDENLKRNYARHLSENQLHTQFLVKTVNKTAQLVEKISNLQ